MTGLSFTKKRPLNSRRSSAPMIPPHKRAWTAAKTPCVREIPQNLFQAQLSSPESSTGQAFAVFKDSVPLNYSSRLAIISLPQSTANGFALVYMAPLWLKSRIEGDILTGLPLLCPLNMVHFPRFSSAQSTVQLYKQQDKGRAAQT